MSQAPRVEGLQHLVFISAWSHHQGRLTPVNILQVGELLSIAFARLNITFATNEQKYLRPRISVLSAGDPESLEVAALVAGVSQHCNRLTSLGPYWSSGGVSELKLECVLGGLEEVEIAFLCAYHSQELYGKLLPLLGLEIEVLTDPTHSDDSGFSGCEMTHFDCVGGTAIHFLPTFKGI